MEPARKGGIPFFDQKMFEYTYILIAFILDLFIGDPEWFPHPVKGIGLIIRGLEKVTRSLIPKNEYAAGAIAGSLTVLISVFIVWGSIELARFANDLTIRVVTILWLYMGLSVRSMAQAAKRIYKNLDEGDISKARKSLSNIVGRDTGTLDESGISRAAVESVAENTVDGIVSPLFFALAGGLLGGAIGSAVSMWAFKAVSTCDSMIGYKNERYERFGTFSARLDDIANYLPARLAFFLFPAAAGILGYSAKDSWRIACRDYKYHSSPNAGIPEAAAAGALNIRLGGTTVYNGIPNEKEPFGKEFPCPEKKHIKQSLKLMWTVTMLMLLILILIGVLNESYSIFFDLFIFRFRCQN